MVLMKFIKNNAGLIEDVYTTWIVWKSATVGKTNKLDICLCI